MNGVGSSTDVTRILIMLWYIGETSDKKIVQSIKIIT